MNFFFACSCFPRRRSSRWPRRLITNCASSCCDCWQCFFNRFTPDVVIFAAFCPAACRVVSHVSPTVNHASGVDASRVCRVGGASRSGALRLGLHQKRPPARQVARVWRLCTVLRAQRGSTRRTRRTGVWCVVCVVYERDMMDVTCMQCICALSEAAPVEHVAQVLICLLNCSVFRCLLHSTSHRCLDMSTT